jgi:predicted dinucleotide-binding enzyme
MNITVIGRGRVGGGLADRWERAGHTVTRLGRDGGAALDADAVLVAVPSGQIAAALDSVSGLEGKLAIDATNAFDGRDEAYQSLAHEVKAIVGGPVAKTFNLQNAALYDHIDEQPVRPSNIYVAEDGAREAAEALSRDAGYEPVFAGGLEQARVLEDAVELFGAIRRAGGGPYFHRFAKPGELAAPVSQVEPPETKGD